MITQSTVFWWYVPIGSGPVHAITTGVGVLARGEIRCGYPVARGEWLEATEDQVRDGDGSRRLGRTVCQKCKLAGLAECVVAKGAR